MRDVIVVGGGCYGSFYAAQLARAKARGKARFRRVVVVDREPECRARRELGDASDRTFVVRDWRAYFHEFLGAAAPARSAEPQDYIVPSPLMPHLMGEWLVNRARERFGDAVETRRFDHVPDVPWERAGADGTHYVSFATWTCPINCVEPRICPHTRDTRTWSLPDTLGAYASGESGQGRATESAVLFCRHRAYGVGMFDTAEVIAADERIRTAGDRGATDIVIGTVSHCHGALTRLVIATPAR